MERNGIRGNCLKWFKNYLSYRSYHVKINNNLSEQIMSSHGVPQGSKLGPILYIIYANDMMSMLKKSRTFAYADDTAIIVTHTNINIAGEIMQNQLNIVTKWCHDNGLVINASKTKLMHIKPPHILQTNVKLKFHNINCLHANVNTQIDPKDNCNTHIEMVKTFKYLGVFIDQNFKWKSHIEYLRKKLRKAAFMLFHLSNCATTAVLMQAYFSLGESYLRHGITAWGSATYCRSLQNTQDRLLKILWKNQNINKPTNNSTNHNSLTNLNINNNDINVMSQLPLTNILDNNHNNNTDNTHSNSTRNQYNNNIVNNYNINNSTHHSTTHNTRKSENLAKDLNVLNVDSIYCTTIANEFFNDSRFLHAIDHIHDTRRRAAGKFKVQQYKNNYGKHTLTVSVPTIFNKLPSHIIYINNINVRKKLIKKHFLDSQ